MRSDQVFVLLLIILIPMTGCFDNSVGDAEGVQDSGSVAEDNGDSESSQYILNQEPLIYGVFGNCVGECYYQGDWYDSLVSASDFFAVDPDGNIADFGMDLDNDFEIDWSFPWNWNESYSETMPQFDYSLIIINPPGATNNPDAFCSTGYMNVIAEDNLGLKEIRPVKWRFDWDTEEQICLIGQRS